MDFDKREECGVCSALKMDMSFGHEGGGDFSLPDYMPEIQRLLYVVPTVLPETKFLSGNILEMGGTLTYSVLYIGGDGKPVCSSLVSEYSTDTALPVSVDNVNEIFVDCEGENTTCRVLGPRSLNIKTRLRSRVMSDERLEHGEEILTSEGKKAPLDLEASVEKLSTDFSSVLRFHGMTTGSVSGDISLPGGASPISCEGVLAVSHSEAMTDGIFVRGEVFLKCLFSETDSLGCKKTKIPFEITVPVADIRLPALSRAWGRVASVSLSPSENEGCFNVSAEYDIEGEALSETVSSLCNDAYSIEVESTCDTRECEMLTHVCFGTGIFSADGDFDVKGSAENASVTDVEGCVGPMQVICADGKMYAVGNVKMKVILEGEDLSFAEYDLPVRYELPCSRVPESSDLQSRIVCCVLQTSGKLTGSKLALAAELTVSFEILEKRRRRFVTAVRLGKEKPEGAVGSGVKVYYPATAESIWSVCKKYHASRGRILKVNGIEGDVVMPGKPVIIF